MFYKTQFSSNLKKKANLKKTDQDSLDENMLLQGGQSSFAAN